MRAPVNPDWDPSLPATGVEPSPVVLTVLRLLSTADAWAVFLFASARSRSSMLSWLVAAASEVSFDLLQPSPPAMSTSQTAAGS